MKTIMGLKDGLALHEDMKEGGCKEALHIWQATPPLTSFHVFAALYILSKENKTKFLNGLSSLKAPMGYMSNMKSCISLDKTIYGLKSHDYHILIQQVFLKCVNGWLPPWVLKVIMKLIFVLNKICSKVEDLASMDSTNEEVAITLCLLELEFPPSFFDPITHLIVHLVEELHLCGLIHNWWMYLLKLHIKYMKSNVQNKA